MEKAGIEVVVAAGHKGKCIGKFGAETEATLALSEVKGSDFDAILFIGGPGVEEYQRNEDYLRLAREAKILGAICIAPMLISDAGVLEGKRVTGWDDGTGTQKNYIERNGGIFTGEEVTIDGNVITASGPDAAGRFGEEILKKLK